MPDAMPDTTPDTLATTTDPTIPPHARFLERLFGISHRGSTVGREVRGGFATFFTMAYIVVLNPLILGFVKDADGQYLGGGATLNIAAIAAGTALVAGVLTILMGVFGNYPLALATGLGLNAFVAFSIASQMTWADAMGVIVLEGLVILLLVLTGFRTAVFHAVPNQLNGWPTVVFAVGLGLLITLWVRKVMGAIIISILVMTLIAFVVEAIAEVGPTVTGVDAAGNNIVNPLGWNLNVPAWPSQIDPINFGTLGEFNLLGSFGRVGIVATVLLVFTLMLADFFDTMGTMTAIGAEADLLDEDGTPPNTERTLVVDSLAAAGGAAGVSSNTSYIESAAGVGEGARTGLASVVTGVLFLASILVSPLVRVIPNEAAVPP